MYDLWGWMMQNCIHPLPLVVIPLAPPLLRGEEGGKEKMSLIGADLASVTKWWRVMNGGKLIDHESLVEVLSWWHSMANLKPQMSSKVTAKQKQNSIKIVTLIRKSRSHTSSCFWSTLTTGRRLLVPSIMIKQTMMMENKRGEITVFKNCPQTPVNIDDPFSSQKETLGTIFKHCGGWKLNPSSLSFAKHPCKQSK